MRFRHGLTAVAATVFAMGALGACSDGAKDVVDSAGKAKDAASMECDDPQIPMGEWKKRCASEEAAKPTKSSAASPKASESEDEDAAAPASEPSTAPASAAKVGDTVSVTGRDGAKFDVTLVQAVDPAQSGSQYYKVDPGLRLVALQWRITNTGTAAAQPSPSYETTLIDADGQTFDSTYLPTTAGAAFPSSAQIPPGESRLGFITYDIPENVKIAKVEYEASYDKPPVSWQLG